MDEDASIRDADEQQNAMKQMAHDAAPPYLHSAPEADGELSATQRAAQELARRIKEFRENYSGGTVVVVFGLPAHGKTFLNKRLVRGNSPEQTGLQGGATEGTRRGSYTSTETQFAFDKTAHFMVIDLPGEDFNAHMAGEPLSEVYPAALEAMDAIIIYMSAGALPAPKGGARTTGEDPWHTQYVVGAGRRGGISPESIYIRFFSYIRTQLKIDEPAHTDQEAVRQAVDGSAIAGSSPPGGDHEFGIEDPVVALVQQATGFKPVYFAVSKADRLPCWVNLRDIAIPRERSSLQALAGMSQSLFRAVLGAKPMFYAAGHVCSHEGQIGTTEASNDSFGVTRMFHIIWKMRKAVLAQEDPAMFRMLDNAVMNPLEGQGLLRRIDQWLMSLVKISKQAEFDFSHRYSRACRVILAAGPILLIIAVAGLFTYRSAEEVAKSERLNIDEQIRGQAGLPAGFALDAGELWKRPSDWRDVVRRQLRKDKDTFQVEEDFLVAAPPQQPNGLVALMPDPNSKNGREVTRIFGEITKCRSNPRCGQGRPPEFTSADTVTRRAFHYASALEQYYRAPQDGDYVSRIQAALNEFEAARINTFKNSQSLNEFVLPTVARQLIMAHAGFRVDFNEQDAMARYGNALEEAFNVGGKARPLNEDALAKIGVDRNQLARHMLAATLVSKADDNAMILELKRRLSLLGLEAGHDALLKVSSSTKSFSDKAVACLVTLGMFDPSGQRTSESESSVDYRRCTVRDAGPANSTFGKQMWVRSRLVDADTWADPAKRTDISFSPYLDAIKHAIADAAADSSLSSSERNALSSLGSINDPGSAKFKPLHIAIMVAMGLASGAFAYLTWCYLTLRAALVLRISPYWKD
ncbi:hypothetical protein [Pseudoduganella umbonata]|uniref:Uncharacterized protein n=1 Tax=Pseudoduganella umbonata TaxID=864828 RepID=A0A4P8HLD1_9BURK|nr:hypothetical protein [Pseudoduganella umbonata]MBB3221283.1 hypothetical protein [Pseudoduganella umbonata]QCP10457.1 hypothetical protein FCL38_08465 [Pseudoduganella umbonata]